MSKTMKVIEKERITDHQLTFGELEIGAVFRKKAQGSIDLYVKVANCNEHNNNAYNITCRELRKVYCDRIVRPFDAELHIKENY